MKVRYTFPVRGMLRVQEKAPVRLYDWSFEFVSNRETGFVDRLVVEIGPIPKEKWPSLTEIERDPNATNPVFPFNINPNKVRFGEFEPQIINLESYLSVFGLEAIEIGRVVEEWVSDPGDETVSMLAGFSVGASKNVPPTEAINEKVLARCAVASNKTTDETAAFAHFRVGQAHFFDGRYIEAIRHLYLCLEHLYGKAANELAKSKELRAVIEEELLKGDHKSFSAVSLKYSQLFSERTSEKFCRFIVYLRNNLQHANKDTAKIWHPSRQGQFEHEAVCLMNIVEVVCWNKVMARLDAIPSTAGAKDNENPQ